MIIPNAIQQRFDLDEPHVRLVASRVKERVLAFSEENGFAFTSRIKTKESVAEKLESGRYTNWLDVDDLFACTIIIPTLSAEEGVLDFLTKTYRQVHLRRRGLTKKDPNTFRFDASRFIGRLPISPSLETESPASQILFEVQIRTAFEHAWSVATHALTYKTDDVDWRKLRVVSQIKASVEQLDGLILSFEDSSTKVTEHPWPEILAKKHIKLIFQALINNRHLPEEALPNNWSRFCDNLFAIIWGSTKNKSLDRAEVTKTALSKITGIIKDPEEPRYPFSLTLIQYCVGCLVKAGHITGPIQKYTPLISQEFLDLYPEGKLLGSGFIFPSQLPN